MAARLECHYKPVNKKCWLQITKLQSCSRGIGGRSGHVLGYRRKLRCSCPHRTLRGSKATVHGMSEREKTLTINELYQSIQGESTWVGWPCVFVRLTFCNLRCNYCDTAYAFYEGNKRRLAEILDTVAAYRCPVVEITGGEPLLQKNVMLLMSMLCDSGYTVLLETSGAHDISKVDPRVHRIMDLKTPGSGEVDKN